MLEIISIAQMSTLHGNLSSSLLTWIKVLEIFINDRNTRALGICYLNIAHLHLKSHRYEEALQNYVFSIREVQSQIAELELREKAFGFNTFTVYERLKKKVLKKYSTQSDSQSQNIFEIKKLEIIRERNLLYRIKFDRMFSYAEAFRCYLR